VAAGIINILVIRIYLVKNLRTCFELLWNQIRNRTFPIWPITTQNFLSPILNPLKRITGARVHDTPDNRSANGYHGRYQEYRHTVDLTD